jgi:hypothetical protein
LNVGERAFDVEHEEPRRVRELKFRERLRQGRLIDPPLALAASLHDVVGPEDLLVRADARVNQPLVGA